MRRVALGATELQISPLGLGSWAIGGPWERGWGAQDDQDSIRTITHAVESGINWIDTAAVYGHGHSEKVVGAAVNSMPEADRPYVFTKCGRVQTPTGVQTIGSVDSIRRECEDSLVRLGVEQIDLYQLHWPPLDGTPLEDTWGALAELQAAGKVNLLGACNMSIEQLNLLESVAHVDVIQPPLSLINRTAVDSLNWCVDNGAGAITYSPMQSGLLTGKYDAKSIAAMDDGDWRKTDKEFTAPRLDANLVLLGRLTAIAAEVGCSVSELAVAWTLYQPGVSGAIVGARRPEQIDGWIGAAALDLADDIRAALADAVVELEQAQSQGVA